MGRDIVHCLSISIPKTDNIQEEEKEESPPSKVSSQLNEVGKGEQPLISEGKC